MALPLLGSELFINRTDTPEQLRSWVDQMADAGLKLVRVFALWDLIQPAWDMWDFEAFDAVFDQCQRRGLGVVPTAFSACPPGWMRRSIASQEVVDPWDPDLAPAAEQYLGRLVDRYADHPALHSWIVWNEAGMVVLPTPRAAERFHAFLQGFYGTIEALNDRYYGQYESFDQVQPPHNEQDAEVPIPSHVQRIDWWRFCTHDVTAAVVRFTRIIRQRDGRHPVHLNPHRLGHCMLHEGQSVWQIADVVDFVGCSAHPVWHSTRLGEARYTQSIGLFSMFCRGATRQDQRFWVSELQGGPAAFSGFVPGGPTPTDITHWVWESIGRGAEAVVFWTFNGRREGGEVGEWMLLDQKNRPSPRLLAVTEAADLMDRHRTLFEQTKPAPARVGLLWSEASVLHGFAFGHGEDPQDPRNAQRNADAVCGAFCLLDDLHLEVEIIDETRLREPGRAEGFALIVLPDAWSLDGATIDRLRDYVAAGGHVIADGLVGYLDPWTRRHDEKTADLDQLFGGGLVDYLPTPNPIQLDTAPPVPGWFNRIQLDAERAEPIVAWPDGSAAVTRCTHPGGGRATRIGTHLFQRYLTQPTPAALQWVRSLLADSAWPGTRPAADTPPSVRVRRLDLASGPDTELLILINTADAEQHCQLHLDPGIKTIRDLTHDCAIQPDGSTLSLALPAHAVQIIALNETENAGSAR